MLNFRATHPPNKSVRQSQSGTLGLKLSEACSCGDSQALDCRPDISAAHRRANVAGTVGQSIYDSVSPPSIWRIFRQGEEVLCSDFIANGGLSSRSIVCLPLTLKRRTENYYG